MRTSKIKRRKQTGCGKGLRKLPVTHKNYKQLQKDWEFMTISAHGQLNTSTTFIVPENTYIIFNGPSGCLTTTTTSIPFQELLAKESNNDFYYDMMDEILEPAGLLHQGRFKMLT